MVNNRAPSSACGINCVCGEQLHLRRRTRTPTAHASPATRNPTASITRGGRPVISAHAPLARKSTRQR
eukprot:11179988-Lingulodinium_polyedra.AAC.1